MKNITQELAFDIMNVNAATLLEKGASSVFNDILNAQTQQKQVTNQKNKRRSKKDKSGRDFVCGCGKEYLSYPALYTHIKTKHAGTQPMGTQQQPYKKSKRGRPKKHDQRDDIYTSMDISDIPEQGQMLGGLGNMAATGFDYLNLPEDFVTLQDFPIIEKLQCKGVTKDIIAPLISPRDSSNITRPTYHVFYKLLVDLKSKQNLDQIINCRNCDGVFGLFLYYCSRLCNDEFYQLLAVFFKTLRECLNQFGYKILKENNVDTKLKTGLKNSEFCEAESPEFIPLIGDMFILEYLTQAIPEFNLDIAVQLFYYFCKWLQNKNLTKFKLDFYSFFNSHS